jgi:signal transduction histidine kinase
LGERPVKGIDLELRPRKPEQCRTRLVTAALVALAALTGALMALELVHPVYSIGGGARAAIETAIAAAAVLTCGLLTETFARGRQLRELLLLLGICALAVGGLSYWVGPVVAGMPRGASDAGVRLACELLGALALVGAALMPPSVIIRPVRARARVAIALGVGTAVGTAVLAEVLTAHVSSIPASVSSGGWGGHFVATSVDLLTAATLAVAGLAFVARFWRAERGTELLAAASLLLAAGSAQFVALPSVPAGLVTVGDAARALAFALLLGGAYLRYAAAQRHQALAAIRFERERVARDLHDGLAQDLACITTQAQRLDCQLDAEHPLVLATRDALTELRGMIADLTASAASTSEEAVRLLAHDLGRRLDLEVNVRTETDDLLGADRSLEPGSREDLIRATREAIVTAAGHGEDRSVDVALSHRYGRVVVQVSRGAEDVPAPPVGVAIRSWRARGVPRPSVEWSRRVVRRRPV